MSIKSLTFLKSSFENKAEKYTEERFLFEEDYVNSLLTKAERYNIDYNIYNVNLERLEQEVEEFEQVMHDAKEYGVEDPYFFDLESLRDAVQQKVMF